MKTKITLFTFLLIVSTCFGQWTQVGADMDGVDTGDGMMTDGEYSGHSVSLSSDGSIVAIGAYNHDSGKGTTRIYQNNAGTWQQIGADIDGVDNSEYSGYSVSLSSDGSIVAIGAKSHDSYKGTTRIFNNSTLHINTYGEAIEGLQITLNNGEIVSNLDNVTIQVYTILGQVVKNKNLKPFTIYIVKSSNTKGQKQVNKLYFN